MSHSWTCLILKSKNAYKIPAEINMSLLLSCCFFQIKINNIFNQQGVQLIFIGGRAKNLTEYGLMSGSDFAFFCS